MSQLILIDNTIPIILFLSYDILNERLNHELSVFNLPGVSVIVQLIIKSEMQKKMIIELYSHDR